MALKKKLPLTIQYLICDGAYHLEINIYYVLKHI